MMLVSCFPVIVLGLLFFLVLRMDYPFPLHHATVEVVDLSRLWDARVLIDLQFEVEGCCHLE